MTTCSDPQVMVENRVDRIKTQFRESPNLLFLLRNYLGATAEVADYLCEFTGKFQLENAVGDQLTLLGERLGWPRCHCVCVVKPTFGFDCLDETDYRSITGFCVAGSTWDGCDDEGGLADLCISDDDLYRRFLQVRIYQHLSFFDLRSLETCMRILFGPQAGVLHAGQGRVVVTPGRLLTNEEVLFLQLYARVLPVAIGIKLLFHFDEKRVFGFGEGWGGFMEPDMTLTEQNLGYQRTGLIFGFCEDQDATVGGFCEEWLPEGSPIATGALDGDGQPIYLVDETGDPIYTGPLTDDAAWLCRQSAPWMCEVDPHPYDC